MHFQVFWCAQRFFGFPRHASTSVGSQRAMSSMIFQLTSSQQGINPSPGRRLKIGLWCARRRIMFFHRVPETFVYSGRLLRRMPRRIQAPPLHGRCGWCFVVVICLGDFSYLFAGCQGPGPDWCEESCEDATSADSLPMFQGETSAGLCSGVCPFQERSDCRALQVQPSEEGELEPQNGPVLITFNSSGPVWFLIVH